MEVELELLFSTIQYNYKWAYYMSHHKISTMPNPIQQSNLFFFLFLGFGFFSKTMLYNSININLLQSAKAGKKNKEKKRKEMGTVRESLCYG